MLSRFLMIWLLLLIVSGTVAQDTRDRYIGIPVGTVNDQESNIFAEVYIADDHTIVFDKFSYTPEGNSCSAVIIGPARKEDTSRKVGPGILLPYAQLDFSWEDLRLMWKRKKRQLHDHSMGIDEMVGNLELKNPRWHLRGSRSTTAPNHEASYEIIEYVDDEEETEESEDMAPKKPPFVPHIQDGEVYHRKSTTSAPSKTTQSMSTDETVNFSTTDNGIDQDAFNFLTSLPMETRATVTTTTVKPMIVFTKRKDIKMNTKKSRIKFKPTTIKLPPTTPTTTTTITTPESTSEKQFVPKVMQNFIVPSSENEAAIFLLTNGAKIIDYKWLGIWDACQNISTPYIWLAGVDPPREEEVLPLKDEHGTIISGSLRILNCNTILVQKLYYKPVPDKLSTYFCIGTRSSGTEQRSRVKVIGYEHGEPLEQFDGDDIMLRLPKGIRTFDVDFISIYNEDYGKTLAKVDLPNALVPPCND